MRVFHMNLEIYAVNVGFPTGGAATPKHTSLRNEMVTYAAGKVINIAGFTESHVPNNFKQANLVSALDDFGAALNIPTGGTKRKIAVIRCGRTALQDNNEVVAIVLDGNATINNYGLKWFSIPQQNFVWHNLNIPATGNFTHHLNIPDEAVVDYRYIVYVDFNLGIDRYVIGFIHNRVPRSIESAAIMQHIRPQVLERNLLNPDNLTLLGGDFNVSPLAGGTGQGVLSNGHHGQWYYSPGLTTNANRYDYWISQTQLNDPTAAPNTPATSDSTPTAPSTATTGSDHRGVGLEYIY